MPFPVENHCLSQSHLCAKNSIEARICVCALPVTKLLIHKEPRRNGDEYGYF